MAGSIGTIIPALGPIQPIIQDNLLLASFEDSLFPGLLFRSDADREMWPGQLGDEATKTRTSTLEPIAEPLAPGADPVPVVPSYEQWSVKAAQYSSGLDTNMMVSRTALASTFVRNAQSLGMQAGQSLNRKVRDRLYLAYTSGDTLAIAAGVAVTTISVESLNGFTQVMDANQRLQNVSPAFPKGITIAGHGAANVIGAAPSLATNPLGPGTLTLQAAATWAADAYVRANDRPTIIRAGGAATVDNLLTTSGISLAEIRQAVAILQRNSVMPHEDGYYHVHLDPMAVSQIFADNEFQRLTESIPDNLRYAQFIVGQLLRCRFYTNAESPTVYNSGVLLPTGRGSSVVSQHTAAPMRNKTGVAIIRTIITGRNSIYERYIDESELASEAGYSGKVGKFSIVNNGVAVATDGVRYIIRAPMDRLQQNVSQSWSFTGDWGIPTDFGGGQTGAKFKRAIVIESGSTD